MEDIGTFFMELLSYWKKGMCKDNNVRQHMEKGDNWQIFIRIKAQMIICWEHQKGFFDGET